MNKGKVFKKNEIIKIPRVYIVYTEGEKFEYDEEALQKLKNEKDKYDIWLNCYEREILVKGKPLFKQKKNQKKPKFLPPTLEKLLILFLKKAGEICEHMDITDTISHFKGLTIKVKKKGNLNYAGLSIHRIKYRLCNLFPILKKSIRTRYKGYEILLNFDYCLILVGRRTKTPIFPSILSPWFAKNILNKGKTQPARFFRPSGPEWIDFEEGYVSPRKETDIILEKLDNIGLVIIQGNPASGKSVILRSIAYHLSDLGKDVYLIELKKALPPISDIFSAKNAYCLVDDAHLNLEYTNHFVKMPNLKVLIATRDIATSIGPQFPFKIGEYIKDAMKIPPEDVADNIITHFSEKGKKIPKEMKEFFTKTNLWMLAWELKAYEEFGKINKHTVYERIKDHMRRDLKYLGISDAENILLPLAIFYRFEAPVRKDFIREFANLKDIESLIKLDEITNFEKNGFEYLAMHHSEVAKLFYWAFQEFEGLGDKIKKTFKKSWFEGITLASRYIESFPEESAVAIDWMFQTNPAKLRSFIKSNWSTILKAKVFIKALEKKDIYTKGHSERVMKYSIKIGENLKLTKCKMKILADFSILHDIWKLTVDSAILNKPDKLNNAEWEIIKRHKFTGAVMMLLLDTPMSAKSIIACHHEYMEKGYSHRLMGNKISFLAQIVAVADAFDHLTTPKAYRRAMSVKDALDVLVGNEGIDKKIGNILKDLIESDKIVLSG